jgi:alkylation response protein AidB-like acyl-CoA dehydrogenase
MDFSVPESLRSLRKSLRQLVETELKPHDATIEENGHIPPQALDAIRAFGCTAATRRSVMAGSASTCWEIALLSRKLRVRTSRTSTPTA